MKQIQLIGHIGQNAELKTINQRTYIAFSLAVTDGYGEKKTTEWFDVLRYVGDAQKSTLQNYLVKGAKVYVQGSFATNAYLSKGTGEARHSTSVYARDLELLSSMQQGTQAPQTLQTPQQAPQQNQAGMPQNNDLPF